MSLKLSKRIAVVFLVMCYCCGQMIFPIGAQDSLFDELLAERQETVIEENVIEEPKQNVKIEDFSDVKQNDWFYPYLDYLVANGLINGKTPDSFEPQSSFSYAECSAVIVRYLSLEEEAQRRMENIAKRLPDMQNVWYAGYFEVLLELGLFDGYNLFESQNGFITAIDREAANSPIVRYRFAESISKSFELDSDLRARNVYSEMGGSGREFIIGGGYIENILDEYRLHISDYEDIPESSQRNVLKAYYNGIFNGDISGNFYPNNNLTRAEMAKVLATISDLSLRTRLITDGYGQKVTEDMLHTDAFGVKTLDVDVWQDLLVRETENLSVNNGRIEYTSSSQAPEGYAVDVYLYQKSGTSYILETECTLRNGNDGGFTYNAKDARALFVLRNTKESSRPEGTVDVTIEGGSVVSIRSLIRET